MRYLVSGMHVHTDDIIITSGALDALNLCLRAVTRPGDAVIIESPSFYGALQALERLGLRAIEVPTHPREGVDLTALTNADDVVTAARTLIARGPAIVLVTSVRFTGDSRIATLAVTAQQAWRVSTPYVDLLPMPNGMGDCIAALFLGRYLQHRDIALALSQSVSSLYALVRGTDAGMPRDLNLVAMQDALVRAPEVFATEPL